MLPQERRLQYLTPEHTCTTIDDMCYLTSSDDSDDSDDGPTVSGRLASVALATGRKITMETSLTANLAKCHQQEQSPLYNKIPKEVRDLIFQYATDRYEDLSRKYPENAYHYRPGHRGPLKTCTHLLSTCRRIWLETNSLPMRQMEFTLWLEVSRGPRRDSARKWTRRLTSLNVQNFNIVHYFLQKNIADTMFDTPTSSDEMLFAVMKPTVLHVTYRHTDWNRWEDATPLVLDDRWVKRVLSAPRWRSIQEFRFELETLEEYKDQLQVIVEHLTTLQGEPRPGLNATDPRTQLKISGQPELWHWTGPPDIGNQSHEAHKDMSILKYRVMTITWRARRVVESAAPQSASSKCVLCDYYAPVTLQHMEHEAELKNWADSLVESMRAMKLPFKLGPDLRSQVRNAAAVESVRRRAFEKLLRDFKTKEIIADWKNKGSLLKFED